MNVVQHHQNDGQAAQRIDSLNTVTGGKPGRRSRELLPQRTGRHDIAP